VLATLGGADGVYFGRGLDVKRILMASQQQSEVMRVAASALWGVRNVTNGIVSLQRAVTIADSLKSNAPYQFNRSATDTGGVPGRPPHGDDTTAGSGGASNPAAGASLALARAQRAVFYRSNDLAGPTGMSPSGLPDGGESFPTQPTSFPAGGTFPHIPTGVGDRGKGWDGIESLYPRTVAAARMQGANVAFYAFEAAVDSMNGPNTPLYATHAPKGFDFHTTDAGEGFEPERSKLGLGGEEVGSFSTAH